MENERKRILNMVEKGTITATEALTLLEALEKEPGQKASQSESTHSHSHTSSQSTSSHSTDKTADQSGQGETHSWKKDFPFNLDEFFQTDSKKKPGGQPADRIMDFVQNAFEKVKGMDLEFNIGPSLEFKHTYEVQNADDIHDIEISVANGKVSIRPWDENYVKAECDVKVYRSEDEIKARKQLQEAVVFAIQYKKLRFLSDLKMIKIDTVIFVPRNSYDRWDVRLFNGKFQGESANVNKLKVKTANGKIELSNMLMERAELETANGGIDVSNTRADLIDAESVNGKVSVEGAIDEMDVQSLNGNVICKTSSNSARKIEAKTLAGTINIFVPEAANLDGTLKSNFGRFDINHREMDHVEEREELMQRKLHFTREKNDGSKLYLFADAKTGAVSVKPYQSNDHSTESNSEE
ncbi:hypothetical protein C4B60_11540 [Jeotgalibacillus proteolyticus]|uniref:Uncharacterized protein n=2 Tax=Jeotgalibacillus proteolyticus TaxID=2082395 RepID=A0A2S5GB39_9BACL|nr:hypothetical protein C4B60_11540 [Jeotgalibacillus proteolyticus]